MGSNTSSNELMQINTQSDQNMSEMGASEEVIQRFAGSYGVRSTLMSFFAPRELIKAQILSKHFYEKKIAEVQTRIGRLEGYFLFYG